jgi:hypothetical protein
MTDFSLHVSPRAAIALENVLEAAVIGLQSVDRQE